MKYERQDFGVHTSAEDLSLIVTLETLLHEIRYNNIKKGLDKEASELAQRKRNQEISGEEYDAHLRELEMKCALFLQLPKPGELTADQALSLFRGEEEDALNGTVNALGVSPR